MDKVSLLGYRQYRQRIDVFLQPVAVASQSFAGFQQQCPNLCQLFTILQTIFILCCITHHVLQSIYCWPCLNAIEYARIRSRADCRGYLRFNVNCFYDSRFLMIFPSYFPIYTIYNIFIILQGVSNGSLKWNDSPKKMSIIFFPFLRTPYAGDDKVQIPA